MKSRRRRSRTKLDSYILEEDQKIIENSLKINEQISGMHLPDALNRILTDKGHLAVYFKKLEKSLPVLGNDISESISISAIRDKLQKKGIKKLYKYQEEVIQEILDGNNVIISASTGLGKTEAFLLPIIHAIIRAEPNPATRKGPAALLIYPTKALAADQNEKINYYCSSVGLRVSVFDGDTPSSERQQLYQNPPDILITNPDMIHYHLMSNITFQGLISQIRFLVLDEIHLCVGSYGTNVLWIIRRMRRFSPGLQCIGASATIANAEYFTSIIFDKSTSVVATGAARKSDMYLTILYPKERSNLSTMAQVTEYFVRSGNKTLSFGNGHLSSESLNMILKNRGLKSQIHRAGLSISHRKKVEKQFREHLLDVLISTPTLELGIDIGELDSVVSMLTSLTSFFQRIGRAGRKGQDSYATLVLRGDDPISAYFARNPSDYLGEFAPIYVEPDNKVIAKKQIIAMLIDKQMNQKETKRYHKYIGELIEQKFVITKKNKTFLIDKKRAQNILHNFSIRGIGKSVSIRDDNHVIGERTLPMALSELHPGAIYLHGGRSYKVKSYNEKMRISKVSTIPSMNEKTQALRKISPRITSILEENEINGLATAYCELELVERVHGYYKQNIFTNKVIGRFDLERPISYKYETRGFICKFPRPYDIIEGQGMLQIQNILGGTYHAIEHVLIESGNSLTGGGANQIGGIAMGDTGSIFVYDGTEGGSGLSRLLYDSLNKGLIRSLQILKDCPCNREDGCPRCCMSQYCGNNNRPLNRLGAIETLKMIGRESTDLEMKFSGVESFVIFPT